MISPVDAGEWTYYVRDHLGSTRVVINDQCGVKEYYTYFPFGLEIDGWCSIAGDGKARFKFTGKELDDEDGLGWYYFGARYYDPEVGIWLTPDPLAGKYPSLSPYSYAANNPFKFIDPDGEELLFAQGVSSTFKKQFAEAVQYLNKYGAAGIIAELHAAEEVYYIAEDTRSHHNPNINTIYWAPTLGVLTTSGNRLSPAVGGLLHEASHALFKITDFEQYKANKKTVDPQYTNLEERRVILGAETEAARKTGEIGPKDISRPDHKGKYFRATGPTSTVPIVESPVLRIEEKKEEEEDK